MKNEVMLDIDHVNILIRQRSKLNKFTDQIENSISFKYTLEVKLKYNNYWYYALIQFKTPVQNNEYNSNSLNWVTYSNNNIKVSWPYCKGGNKFRNSITHLHHSSNRWFVIFIKAILKTWNNEMLEWWFPVISDIPVHSSHCRIPLCVFTR